MLERILSRMADDRSRALEVLGGGEVYSYRCLGRAVGTARAILRSIAPRAGALKVGILMDNAPEWISVDLALLLEGHTSVPVPLEFSAEQAYGLIQSVDILLLDQQAAGFPHAGMMAAERRHVLNMKDLLDGPGAASGPGVTRRVQGNPVKAIHTSGTTSRPKGVLISAEALSQKVELLADLIGTQALRRYHSLVPLSLLLEQICGIYLILSQAPSSLWRCGGFPYTKATD